MFYLDPSEVDGQGERNRSHSKVKQTCWVHTSSFPFHSAPFYLPWSLSLHKLRQVHVCMLVKLNILKMSRKLLWFPSQKHFFCCQMQRPGTTPWGPLGLRANAPYEERLEGISAGIGVLAPGPFWRLQKALDFKTNGFFYS